MVQSPVSRSWMEFMVVKEDEVVVVLRADGYRGVEGRCVVHGGVSAGRLDVAAEWREGDVELIADLRHREGFAEQVAQR